jgi:hypothetical protein
MAASLGGNAARLPHRSLRRPALPRHLPEMAKVELSSSLAIFQRTARAFSRLGEAIEATFKMDNVVLEIIREKDPLGEINKGIDELKKRGWKLNT